MSLHHDVDKVGKECETVTFSVIIPLYNKAPHISRALRSVLSQTVVNLEVVVVDDGSTDHGAEIVRGFTDSRVRLIQQSNAGVSAARNRGIETSVGKLIAFIDADDEWDREFLETILRLKMRFPEAGLYATAYKRINAAVRPEKLVFHGIPNAPFEGILLDYFRSAAHGDPPVWTSAACIPREVFGTVGTFPVGCRMGEDADMWGRIALRYPIAFSRQERAIYYLDAVNRACQVYRKESDDPFLTTARVEMEQGNVPESLQPGLMEYLVRLKVENARQYVLAGKYQRARHLLMTFVSPQARFRRFLWGSRINRFAHLAWKLKTTIIDFCRVHNG
jgi:glycosyltransferase involved in cell wall biosynthesis